MMDEHTRTAADRQQRAARLDRLYRRISELDDASLAQLDALTAAAARTDAATLEDTQPVRTVRSGAPPPAMPMPPAEQSAGQVFTRRAFVLALLTGGVVTAAGGTAAILLREDGAASEAAIPTTEAPLSTPTLNGEPPTPAPPTTTPGPAPQTLIDDLSGEVTDLRAERVALRAQLDAAQDELARLSGEINARQTEIAGLQNLLTLYDQLEAAGLDEAIITGMGPLWLAVQAVSAGQSLLEAGIQEAARLLASVEGQAPGIANGLLWLEDQVRNLSTLLQNLEDALTDFLGPVQPVAEGVGNFAGAIIDMLPFGMGQQIRAGLDAIAAILTHIPELIASINPLVITPLRQWVSPEDDDKGLIAEVVQPISDNLVTPAQAVADNAAALESTYLNQFQTPVEQALAQRAAIRASLRAEREALHYPA